MAQERVYYDAQNRCFIREVGGQRFQRDGGGNWIPIEQPEPVDVNNPQPQIHAPDQYDDYRINGQDVQIQGNAIMARQEQQWRNIGNVGNVGNIHIGPIGDLTDAERRLLHVRTLEILFPRARIQYFDRNAWQWLPVEGLIQNAPAAPINIGDRTLAPNPQPRPAPLNLDDRPMGPNLNPDNPQPIFVPQATAGKQPPANVQRQAPNAQQDDPYNHFPQITQPDQFDYYEINGGLMRTLRAETHRNWNHAERVDIWSNLNRRWEYYGDSINNIRELPQIMLRQLQASAIAAIVPRAGRDIPIATHEPRIRYYDANERRWVPVLQTVQTEAERRRARARQLIGYFPRYADVINDALQFLEEFEAHPKAKLSEGESSFITGLQKLTEGNRESIEDANDFLMLSSSLGHPQARCMLQTLAPWKVAELETAEKQLADAAQRKQKEKQTSKQTEKPKPKPKEKEKEKEKPKETEAKICGICDEESKDIVTLGCGHNNWCRDCLTLMVNNAIKEKTVGALLCPVPACKKPMTLEDVRTIVENNPEIMSKFDAVLLKKCLDLETTPCPTAGCDYNYINDAKRTGNVTCPKCKQVYCGACLVPHYDPHMNCEQAEKEHKARLTAGDKQKELDREKSEAWKKDNTKPCPYCTAPIYKDGGCPYVYCYKCNKGGICWHCGGPWDNRHPYDHYGACPGKLSPASNNSRR